MKKQILIGFGLLFGSLTIANAQNIYDTNGTLTGNRTVSMSTYSLNFGSKLFIRNNGNIGIGTTSPSARVDALGAFGTLSHGASHVSMASFTSTGMYGLSFYEQAFKITNVYDNSNTYTRIGAQGTHGYKSFIDFNPPLAGDPVMLSFGRLNEELMLIHENGKVSIGDVSTPDGYKLFVKDGILTEKVKVALESTSDWSDYVFEPGYKLMPLHEVEKFTKENKHLPNVPSANDMVNNGLDVAKMDAKLLEKIEELTLYSIEQDKHINQLTKNVSEQKDEIQELKKQVKALLELKK